MGNKKPVDIEVYLKVKKLVEDETIKIRAPDFIIKAKNDILLTDVLSKIHEDGELRASLELYESASFYDWIVIVSYYAMYNASLALLARLGYRSLSHSSTIRALEEFYVKKNLLREEDITMLNNALLTKEEIENISDAKLNREKAQYDITGKMSKNMANNTMINAKEFIAKCDDIVRG